MADQIRGSHRFDHWLRRHKWWHSIFWWGVQVLMVNSYQSYCRLLENEGLEPMSHYDFQSKIAIAWLDPDFYKLYDGVDPSSMSMSSMSAQSTDTQRKSRVCDASLHPITGSLKCRLNQVLLHWPSPPASSKANCQMHLQACRYQKYKNVQLCKTCNVSLCTDGCYDLFRTEWDVVEKELMVCAECA